MYSLGFDAINKFEENPLNLSCGGDRQPFPETKVGSGHFANLSRLGQIFVDVKKESGQRLEF